MSVDLILTSKRRSILLYLAVKRIFCKKAIMRLSTTLTKASITCAMCYYDVVVEKSGITEAGQVLLQKYSILSDMRWKNSITES